MKPQAVPKAYASSTCTAFAAELVANFSEQARQIMEHTHRCTGDHTSRNGLQIHSCGCGAIFYFLEDALDLLLGKLQEREAAHDVTGIDSAVRHFIDSSGDAYTESYPAQPA